LFFVTTFASPAGINLPGCKPLIDAVKANADDPVRLPRQHPEASPEPDWRADVAPAARTGPFHPIPCDPVHPARTQLTTRNTYVENRAPGRGVLSRKTRAATFPARRRFARPTAVWAISCGGPSSVI